MEAEVETGVGILQRRENLTSMWFLKLHPVPEAMLG
jgi:hypothetical protein